MKCRLATHLTSMIMAMVMILLPGFDVCAETYDSETEIEIVEGISPISIQKNDEKFQIIEKKSNGENISILCIPDRMGTTDFNIIPVNRHKIFCNFRE